jgi:hypothetical protein
MGSAEENDQQQLEREAAIVKPRKHSEYTRRVIGDMAVHRSVRQAPANCFTEYRSDALKPALLLYSRCLVVKRTVRGDSSLVTVSSAMEQAAMTAMQHQQPVALREEYGPIDSFGKFNLHVLLKLKLRQISNARWPKK